MGVNELLYPSANTLRSGLDVAAWRYNGRCALLGIVKCTY